MATISIPIGGRAVPIEVPDFAMENTQQAILEATNKMAVQMGATASAIKDQGQGLDGAADNLDDAARSIRQRLSDAARNLGKESIKFREGVNTFNKFADKQKFSDQASSFFNMIQMPMMAGIMGTGIGILEQFGAAMNNARRVGVGVGEDFMDMRRDVGDLGLTLDQFTNMMITSGPAIRSLGENTSAGTQRLLQLNRAFAETTRNLGYFGLSSTDMTKLLAEEVELRRLTSTSEQMRNLDMIEFSRSISENVALQERMASLTGEDLQQRLANRRALQQDEIVQSALRDASSGTRMAIDILGTEMGTLGESIAGAIATQIATGRAAEAFASEQQALMGGGFQRIRDFVMNNRDSMNRTDFAAGLRQVIEDSIGALDADNLRQLASTSGPIAGVARELLGMQNRLIETGDVVDAEAQARRRQQDAAADGSLAATGLQRDAEVLSNVMRTLTMEFTMMAMGIDPRTGGDAMSTLMQSLGGVLGSENTAVLTRAAGLFMGGYSGVGPAADLFIMGELESRESELSEADQQELARLRSREAENLAQLGTILGAEFGPEPMRRAAEIARTVLAGTRTRDAFGFGGQPPDPNDPDNTPSWLSRILNASQDAMQVIIQNWEDFNPSRPPIPAPPDPGPN